MKVRQCEGGRKIEWDLEARKENEFSIDGWIQGVSRNNG